MACTDVICVIGGGVGGVATAIEAADAGYYVCLIEKKEELMRGTSDVTPGRIGVGFHYFHLPTALQILRKNINFLKRFGHFRQENNKAADHPLRRGRYFIMRNSIIPAGQILTTFEGIKAEYKRLVELDPENMVFGFPDDIYKIMDPAQYADDVNYTEVEYGIDTAEELLDWPKFRRHLHDQLETLVKGNKIEIYTSLNVVGVTQLKDNTYEVKGQSTEGSIQSISAKFIVNATWDAIETINRMIGLKARPRANRLKAMVTIQLPQEMTNSPSMFFFVGPFSMFSNKGHGIGMVTFAPVTNVGISYNTETDSKFEDKISMSSSELLKCGQEIVRGAAFFIPKLADAKILKIRTGFVQSYTDEAEAEVSPGANNMKYVLTDERSHIHFRDYSGVEQLSDTFIVNSCMKLLSCLDNAKLVVDLISKQTA